MRPTRLRRSMSRRWPSPRRRARDAGGGTGRAGAERIDRAGLETDRVDEENQAEDVDDFGDDEVDRIQGAEHQPNEQDGRHPEGEPTNPDVAEEVPEPDDREQQRRGRRREQVVHDP